MLLREPQQRSPNSSSPRLARHRNRVDIRRPRKSIRRHQNEPGLFLPCAVLRHKQFRPRPRHFPPAHLQILPQRNPRLRTRHQPRTPVLFFHPRHPNRNPALAHCTNRNTDLGFLRIAAVVIVSRASFFSLLPYFLASLALPPLPLATHFALLFSRARPGYPAQPCAANTNSR